MFPCVGFTWWFFVCVSRTSGPKTLQSICQAASASCGLSEFEEKCQGPGDSESVLRRVWLEIDGFQRFQFGSI